MRIICLSQILYFKAKHYLNLFPRGEIQGRPGVGRICNPGSTDRVHGGVQTVYIRVETKITHLQNKSHKHG